jgi:hypothetical protein
MMRNEWSRRQLLRAAGAAGLGLIATTLKGADPARAVAGLWSTPISSTTAKLGVFAEPNGTTETSYFQAFCDFQTEIDRAVAIYRTYRSWGQRIFNSTINSILDPAKDNYLPTPELYLSFHAYRDKKGTKCISWSEIDGGCYDADIDAWVTELDKLLAKTGHAYVAFHHEMENQEGTPPIGCGDIGTNCGSPDEFKAAYWHFRARVQDGLQSLNGWPPEVITWVITYMGDTFRGKHGGPDVWWPSSADPSYVPDVADDHLVGVDLYNRYKCHRKPWYSFPYLAVGPTGQGPQPYATSKGRNLFIGECGTVEGDACGGDGTNSKAQWFDDALPLMKSWGNLEAFCYSQVSGFNSGDYRIETSPDALAAFQALANDPFFS